MILKELGSSTRPPTHPLMEVNHDSPVFEPGIISDGGELTFVRRPSHQQLLEIYEMASREIGHDIATLDSMRAVRAHNPSSFWGIYRSIDAKRRNPHLVGFFAFLPLNEAGVAAYQAGMLTPKQPSLEHLAATTTKPAALYLWAVVAHRLKTLAGALIAHAMGIEWFFETPMFGTVGTRSGLNALRNASDICPDAQAISVGEPFELKLPPEAVDWAKSLPVVSGIPPKSRSAKATAHHESSVVHTAEALAKVFAVRAAVFMAEQACPYDEEFDSNDHVAMHILGTIAGEPAATLRIRFFAGFAKLERWAVLPKFRGTMIGRRVVEHALQVCQRKGYRRICVHAQVRYVDKWQRFGFKRAMKNTRLVFSDHEYVEMVCEFDTCPEALTVNSNPYVLIRPEGRWDKPGVLDRSTSRGVLSHAGH